MNKYSEIEAKRLKNLEDNRQFLAKLKINDIREEIKDDETQRRTAIKTSARDCRSNKVRRGSRQRKKLIELENFSTDDEHPKKITKKKTDENRPPSSNTNAKVKLELPQHMLTRYHSNGKRVPLHNHKATFADDHDE